MNAPVGESVEERLARLDLEYEALKSTKPGALRERLLRLIGCGGYIAYEIMDGESDECNSSCTPERAVMRYAAALSKVVAASLLARDEDGSANGQHSDAHLVVYDEDLALVLAALASTLEVGSELLTVISIADNARARDAAPDEAPEAESAGVP